LNGPIPSELGNLSNINDISLDENQLTGALPASFAGLSTLVALKLKDNNLNGLSDLSLLPDLILLTAQNNQLQFDDIEPNINITGFEYVPQAKIGTQETVALTEGDTFAHTISVGGANNQYQWQKDGENLPGTVSQTITIDNIQQSDAGEYVLMITNTLVADLTLESEPITLEVVAETIVSATLSSTTGLKTNLEIIPVTISFSEQITGLSIEDFVVENATLSDLTTNDNITFTLNLNPAEIGPVSIQLPSEVVTDLSDNENEASNKLEFEFENVSPEIELTSDVGVITNQAQFQLTFSFSEPVIDFELEDLLITNATAETLEKIDEETYSLIISPENDGEVMVEVPENAVTDEFGNMNLSGVFSAVFDGTPPTVTLTTDAESPIMQEQFDVTITFSEPVEGFDPNLDIGITNGVLAEIESSDDLNYSATVVPGEEGQIAISIPEGVVQDEAGNINESSNELFIEFMEVITGIEESTDDFFKIYPNPVSTRLIVISGIISSNTEVSIINLSGQIYYRQAIAASERLEIDISNFPNGLFLIELKTSNGESFLKRFVKRN